MNFQQVFTEFEKPYLPVAASTNLNSQQAGSQMVQQQSLIQPQQPQCSICGTTQKLLRCAKCKTIYYCSIDHQHLDWPTHKQECRALAKQRQINNRLQQLTSGCGAININAHSNANIVSSLSHISSSNWTSNSNIPSTYDNNQLDGNAFILGTHENEILNSKAETVTQNSSNCEYVGNFDANSTTTDQMHLMVQNKLDSYLSIDVNQLINDNSHCCQVNQQEQLQEQTQTERSTNNVSPPTITFQPEIQIQEQAQPQTQSHQLNIQQQPYTPQQQQQQLNVTLQYPVPQLSNHIINQHEKSSSYQISTAIVDDNLLENVNERRYEELCRNIINDMNQYGLSVVDDFLGRDKGLQILNEVHQMYSAGVFKDGQLVNNVKSEQDLRTIRGDKITWVKGIEPGCSNIGYLINQIDAVICRANSMRNNGKLGNYIIKERTKAMVACYPGSGSHYVMHVDNPNKDGRVITAIYYLNLNWDSRNNGGVLRIFPEQTKSVADIEPKFDRLIFFWSDKRNPHEVQPAHNTRYAITVWYFDANEREQALNRCKNLQNSNNANINNSASASPASNGKTVKKSSNIVNSDTVASSNTNYSRTSSTVSTPSSSPSTSLPSLSVTTDNVKHPSTTTHTMEIPTKPIQVVRPNTYK